MPIDHVTVPVSDYEAAKRFYERVLAPLGYVVLLDWPDRRRAYLGLEGEPSSVWLVESPSPVGLDLCLAAPDANALEAFQAAAGGDPRVVDPDGNSIEAVYRADSVRRAA